MGRHRFDEKDEHVKWGGPALAEGSAQPARGQDDDSASQADQSSADDEDRN